MREGIKIARDIFHQKAFDHYRGKEISPGENINSDDRLNNFIRSKGDTAYHPSCTCKMGNDDMSVVEWTPHAPSARTLIVAPIS